MSSRRAPPRHREWWEHFTPEDAKTEPCFRCGGMVEPPPAAPNQVYQWSAGCATRSWTVLLCMECDIEANRVLMEFLGITGIPQRLAWYRKRLMGAA